MHEMLTILTDVRAVSLSVTRFKSAAAHVRRVPCARGHSVQPSPNVFGVVLGIV